VRSLTQFRVEADVADIFFASYVCLRLGGFGVKWNCIFS
jgi:hypothetical protein